jgi:signal transduction histidine kinase
VRRRDPRPATVRLRRLRWSLTAAFALFSLAGLVILAIIAARTDAHAQSQARFDEMRRRTTAVVRLLYYEDGRLRLDGLRDDEATQGVPQIAVVTDGRVVFTSRHPRFQVDVAELRRVTARAMAEDEDVRSRTSDRGGTKVDLLASPFYRDSDGSVAGAAIAIADAGEGEARHRTLVTSLVIGCAALTALSLTGGYLLSGRSLRPALAALDQQERFLADAAHELRTPLTALRLNIDAARRTHPGEEGALQRASRTTERMSELVTYLLDRARVMAGAHEVRTERLRLDQLVADVVEELPGASDVTVRTTPSIVNGDPTLLRLAVRNLVDNALRHGRADGAPAEVTVTVEDGVVTVADRGPGLGGAESVFERFRSGSGRGVGIGLSIVGWVAQAHRGSVTHEPAPGGGTRFRLTLGPRNDP